MFTVIHRVLSTNQIYPQAAKRWHDGSYYRQYNTACHFLFPFHIPIMTKLMKLFGERKKSIMLFCSSHVSVFYIEYLNTARSCWLYRENNQVMLE